MFSSTRGRLAAFAFIGGISMSALAAGDYPQRSISLIIGYGAGGSTDICNRVLAQHVSKQFGHQMVVENKPGAGSSLALSYLASQKPDGYTLGSLSTGGVLNQILTPSIKYDVTRDLTPIALVGRYQAGLVVRPDSPYKSLAELIQASKGSGKSLTYSTAGVGTPQHLMAERLAQETGSQWVHVPYKSGPDSILALQRGDVDFLSQTAEWVPYVKDGRLRLLAVYTDQRIPGLDAPTLKEVGYDMAAPSVLGIAGPGKMDPAIVAKLQEAFRQASQIPEFVSCAEKNGIRVQYMDSAGLMTLLKETLTTWKPLLQKFAAKE